MILKCISKLTQMDSLKCKIAEKVHYLVICKLLVLSKISRGTKINSENDYDVTQEINY